MKTISLLSRITLFSVAFGIAGVTAAVAQTASTPGSSTAGGSPHASVLTADEKAELMKDHDAVLAANPDLKTQGDNLKTQSAALKAQGDEQKLHAAMIALDPNVAPILAKLAAAHPSK
jgi:hypothetical protein